MKPTLFAFGSLLLLTAAICSLQLLPPPKTVQQPAASSALNAVPPATAPSSLHLVKANSAAGEARKFAKAKGFNDAYYFFIDLAAPSGAKRFLVYDLQKDSVIHAGLVTHGNCMERWLEGRRYGNESGCGCSSLGKYKVGNAYFGKFGLAFKLHGLEQSNNRAFERYVVLHSHDCVPDKETAEEICQSNGCPTVSPEFLKVLEPLIKNSKKPVLMWIVG